MKKLACLGMIFCAPLALAQPVHLYDGFMVAGALGATTGQYNLSQETQIVETNGLNVFSYNDNPNFYANSPAVMVSLGYSYQMQNNFVFGGYFTAGYADAKLTDEIGKEINILGIPFLASVTTEIQLTNDFALVLKPGYVWKHTTLFYGLIGPRWGMFKTTRTASGLIIDAPTQEASISQSQSAYKTGLTLGLGVQQALTRHYYWGLEYAYTSYGTVASLTKSSPFTAGNIPADLIDSGSAEASSNNLLFSLAYRF